MSHWNAASGEDLQERLDKVVEEYLQKKQAEKEEELRNQRILEENLNRIECELKAMLDENEKKHNSN